MTAGCGGFAEITAHTKKIVFSRWFEAGAEIDLSTNGLRVTKPGKFSKMVQAVEHVPFSGARGRATAQDVIYITERCVMRGTRQRLVAVEIIPGIDPARDIVAASQGRVTIAPYAGLMPLALLQTAPIGLTL